MATAAGLDVEVRKTAAGPLLYVNGKPLAPTVLFVNLHDVADAVHTPLQLGEVETAGRHGVNLVSLTIGIPWPRDGEAPDFAAHADPWIEMALKANPQALLIPRIPVTYPPDFWYQEHPDERMLYDDGKTGIPSIHSAVWRRDAARHLGALVAHLEAKYGDHILAYHPSGQHTGEWFYDRMWEGRAASFEAPARTGFRRYLTAKYGTDAALQHAWGVPTATLATADVPSLEQRQHCAGNAFRDPTTERLAIDFDEFLNVDMADAVALLCRAVKQAAPRKLSVAFYGYPFEVVAPTGLQASGHLALHRLLQSPDVDVLCSPVSYLDRGAGGGGYFMAPVDSVHLHGKLWLVEDDTRTHLAPPDAGYGRLDDARQTRGVLARNFGHIATRGTAVWWMDLPGQGWFAGAEMWEYLSGLQRAYTAALTEATPYRPEIAVFVDEQSPLYGAPNPQVLFPLLYKFRTQWYRIGAPAGVYLLDDLLAGTVPPARFYVILNAFRLSAAQTQTLQQRTGRKGCVTLWMYAPGLCRGDQLSPEYIRDVTGIGVRQIPPQVGSITDAAGTTFANAYAALTPSFAVDDPDAEVLARYAEGGEVAVAAKRVGDSLSVYSGVLQVPASLLRDLARRAGVHIYSDQDDVVMAGNGWLALHANAAGTRTLRLPTAATYRDVVSGATLGPAATLSFDLQQGDTKLLRPQNPPALP
jgi:hypothetical protein